MKYFGKFFIIFTLIVLLAACEKKPVKIGFIADLTGRQSALGVSIRNGFQMAVEELNADGGILKREIQITVKSTNNNKVIAADKVSELLEEEVDVIIGPMNSAMSQPVVDGSEGKLIISPTVSTDHLTGIDDMFFRIIPTASDQGRKLAESVLAYEGSKAIIIIDENNKEYSEPFGLSFIDIYESSGEKQAEIIRYKSKDQFIQIADQVAEINPASLVFVSSGIDTASLIQQVAKRITLPKLYSSYWGKASNVIQFGGRAVEGMILVGAYAPIEKSEREKQFESDYYDRYQSVPTFAAQYGYECLMLYAAAAEKARSLDDQKVKEALLQLESFEGITDSFSLNENGDVLREQSLFIIENGEYVIY